MSSHAHTQQLTQTWHLPERLKHQAEMVLMEKVTIQSQSMKPVVRISIVELSQKLQFLQTSFVPEISENIS